MILRPWHYDMARAVVEGAKVRDAAAKFGRSERQCYNALRALREEGNVPLPPVGELAGRPARARPASARPQGPWRPCLRREKSPTTKETHAAHVARMASLAALLRGQS